MLAFLKWLAIGVGIGIVCGFAGTVFHHCISFVAGVRTANPWIIYLLPVGGLLIALLYFLTKSPITTDQVIDSANCGKPIRLIMAPLIFVSTVITQLVGGSAGREGAAIQLGGSLSYNLGKLLKLDTNDLKIVTMCGISAVFSAMFQTPIGAAIFAVEVISIGHFHYSGFLSSISASFSAYMLSQLVGAEQTVFAEVITPEFSVKSIGWTMLLAILAAGLSIGFCVALKKSEHLLEKIFPNTFLRVLIGAAAVLGLTLLMGNQDFNGAGMNLIQAAVAGDARWWSFLMKILFTVITVGCGFKGGEIVPTMSIGALFGCFFGTVVGLDPGFCAVIGLGAMFSGMVNSPLAAAIIAAELFGLDNIGYLLLACAISYVLSANFSLYKTQQIRYSKIKSISHN